MDEAKKEECRRLLEEAASLVPPESGRLEFYEGPDETHVWGDQVGLLRLGLGLSAGALRPPTSGYGFDDTVDTGVQDVINRGSPDRVFAFRWADDWANIETSRHRLRERWRGVGSAVVGIVILDVLLCAAVGGYVVFEWCKQRWLGA